MKRTLLALLMVLGVAALAAEGFYHGHTHSALDNAGGVFLLAAVGVWFLFPPDPR